jgi:hypothetical protein
MPSTLCDPIPQRRQPCHRRHAGSGTIEFAIVAVPVLLLGFGCIELARWHFVKQGISLALLEAARAGITQNARPKAMKAAFNTALEPLYPPTSGHTSAQRVHTRHARLRAAGMAPWQIEILTPTPEAFTDFADKTLAIARRTGRMAINNNYQQEQDAARRGKGWPQGAGPASGQTIYQANTLTLRLHYPHKPLTPGVSALLRLLGSGASGYNARALSQGYLPLSQELSLTMQSHPVDWPPLADGTVVRRQRNAATPGATGQGKCRGLWCTGPLSMFDGKSGGSDGAPGKSAWLPGDTVVDTPASIAGGTPETATPWPPGPDVAMDDPACGVTLCCLG